MVEGVNTSVDDLKMSSSSTPSKKAKISENVIMVTGASGLVGRAIQSVVTSPEHVPTGNERWVFLSSKDGDLRDSAATRLIFEKHQPTHVIHLAAFVGGLFKNMQFGVQFFEDNMHMTMNVLKLAHEFKVQKCISCLSTCIFPDKTSYPINETMVHDGAPHSSNEGYAYSKRMIDVLNRCYSNQYGCNFTSVIPTNIYGPHDNFNIQDGHVIPGLVHKMKIAMDGGPSFKIWGSGTPLRQFIYSEDLAKLFVWALYNYDDPSPIIFSTDEASEISIADVARAIAKAAKYPKELEFDTTKSDGQFKKTADNSKLMKLNPNFQFTSFENGIQKTVDWFWKNYSVARK